MTALRQLVTLVLACAAISAVHGADAATNWSNKCAKCHGEDGKGDTKMGHKLRINDFTDAAFQAKFTDQEAFKAVKTGLVDAKGKIIMKAIEGLSDEEINALVAHVRSLKK